jgi:hypothetical protein
MHLVHALSANWPFVQAPPTAYPDFTKKKGSIMKQAILYELDRGNLLTLQSRPGQALRLQAGRLWITESGRPCDIVVEANERFVLHQGTAFVEALCDSQVVLEGQAPLASHATDTSRALVRWFTAALDKVKARGQWLPATCS